MKKNFRDHGLYEIGLYERRAIFLLCFLVTFCVFPPLQSIVTQYTPPHQCDVSNILPQNDNFNTEHMEEMLNWTIPFEINDFGIFQRSSCKRYNVSYFPMNVTFEEFYTNTSKSSTIPCKYFTFKAEETSAVTEFGMVCEKSWQQPLFISLLMCGMAVGGMFSGTFSDRFGRKPTLLCSLFLRFSYTLVTSFSSSVTMYGVMVFLTGTTALVDYVTAFVLLTELSPPRFRPVVIFLIEFSYCIGMLLLGLLAYLLPNWRWFLRVIGFLGILYIPYFWWIDESVSWLIASGKLEEAEKVLNKLARTNKQPTKSVESVKRSLMSKKEESASFKKVFKELLKEPALVRRLLTMAYSWFIVCMTFYAIIYSSNNLSGDRYLNILFQALTSSASALLYPLIVPSMGHRRLYLLMMSGVVLIFVLIPFLQMWSPTSATVLAFTAKTFIGVSFIVIYGITAELFPTISRQFAFGVCSCTARFGGIIAPFVLTVGSSGSSYVTTFATAACALLSVMMFGFLPETKNKKLPQTTEEALALKSSWDCCKKQERGNNKEEGQERKVHNQLEEC